MLYNRLAAKRLTRFRQASRLAVTMTALVLLIWSTLDPAVAEPQADQAAGEAAAAVDRSVPDPSSHPSIDPSVAVDEATGTIRELFLSFYALLPKILIGVAIMAAALLLARLARFIFNRRLASWSRAAAASALTSVTLFLIALGTSLSVISGDVRALVGAVGLIGLALSWALQAPIESFTGWLLNSFKAYYRIGDRIEVGDIFGDVYRIDIMTTTLWEVGGGEGKVVQGAQPTGALVTFPNSELLRASVINHSREFPYVWDEVTIGITNESDVPYAMDVIRKTAAEHIGPVMEQPAREYARLFEERRVHFDVDTGPTVFLSLAKAWTNVIVRYLVPVRERRKWSTKLLLTIGQELDKPEHAGRIMISYPRLQLETLDHETADQLAGQH